MNRTKNALILASAMVIYGCGGGGGDGDGPAAPAAPELTKITESNAQKSVGTAYRAGASLYDASYLSSDLAEQIAALKSATGKRASLVAFSAQHLTDLIRRAPLAKSDPVGGIATKEAVRYTVGCSGGGTMEVVANLRNPDRVSNGDRITGTFIGCVESGTRFDGRITIDELTLDNGIAARFGYESLSIADGAQAGRIDGSFRLSMPATIDYNSFVPIDLTQASLRITTNGRTATLQNVASHAEIRFLTGEFRYTLQGRVADSTDGVSVDVSTEAPFSGAGPSLNAGTLRVAGAASSARVTVSAPDRVTIEVDADGDGTYEKKFDEVAVSVL